MLDQINHYINQFMVISKENPVVAGLIGAAGVGAILRWGANIPIQLIKFMKSSFTRTLTIRHNDTLFYKLGPWVSDKVIPWTVKSFIPNQSDPPPSSYSYRRVPEQFSTGTDILDPGVGSCFFWYKKRLFRLTREEIKTENEKIKESYHISTCAISNKIFSELCKELSNDSHKEKKITIYKSDMDDWLQSTEINTRDLSSIAIPVGDKRTLMDHIDGFHNEELWCKTRGVPWRTGILLYGPPGTGKTSLIHAIASHYKKDIYLVELYKLTNDYIIDLFAKVPKDGIICIEDIDVNGANPKNRSSNGDDKALLTLSGLLNAIDGLTSGFGSIVIATTNDINSLDEALIRDGRFDLKMQINYIDTETMKNYLKFLYQDADMNLDGWEINEGVSAASVQKLAKEHKDDVLKVLTTIAKEV